MKIFEKPNLTDFECPICKTNDVKPVTLISIDGTGEGNIIEAVQYHIECIELTQVIFKDGRKIIAMIVL